MSGQVDNRYGQKDTNGLSETITGDKTYTGRADFTDGELVLPVATPVNAVPASGTMTVVARPASYVKNVQAYGAFTAGATNAVDGKTIVFDDQTYTFKTVLVDSIYDVAIGADIAASIINIISKANSNVDSKVDIVRTGNNFVATLKTTAWLGATGNTKVFSTNITDASVDGNFANGVTEVSNYRTVGIKNYIFTTTADGTDPVTDLGASFVRVDSALAATVSVVAEALRTAIDTDPLWTVTRTDAAVTVTALVKGEGTVGLSTGNFAPFVNNCETEANVLPLSTTTLMSGGVNGTPGLKGMEYHDATTNETWKTSEDNYTITQSGWYNTANSASIFLKQDKALTGATAPASETKAFYLIQSCLKLKSKLNGTLGNYIGVKATAAADDTLAIAVTGTGTLADPYLIDIQLANTTGTKNTAALIALAIIAKAESNTIVLPLVAVAATQITAFTVQPLTGGVDGTLGYYLEKKRDTNNTLWTMVHSISSTYYYWSPDCIPAVDTNYVSRYDSSLVSVVWKRTVTGTTAGTHTTNNFDSGLLVGEVSYTKLTDGYIVASGYNSDIISGCFTGAVVSSSWFSLSGQGYFVRTTTATRSELLTKPCIANIEFTYA